MRSTLHLKSVTVLNNEKLKLIEMCDVSFANFIESLQETQKYRPGLGGRIEFEFDNPSLPDILVVNISKKGVQIGNYLQPSLFSYLTFIDCLRKIIPPLEEVINQQPIKVNKPKLIIGKTMKVYSLYDLFTPFELSIEILETIHITETRNLNNDPQSWVEDVLIKIPSHQIGERAFEENVATLSVCHGHDLSGIRVDLSTNAHSRMGIVYDFDISIDENREY